LHSDCRRSRDTAKICKDIEETTGIRTVCTNNGYIQRGGSPSARDRLMASKMGFKAVEILNEGRFNKAICLKDNKIVDIDIEEALRMEKASFDYDMNLAKILACRRKMKQIPNIITCLRICLIPIFCYFLWNENDLVAGLVFIGAALSDVADVILQENLMR
jgi:6-phosphofructokinase